MKAAIQALGHDPAEFEVPLVQIVRLERDGSLALAPLAPGVASDYPTSSPITSLTEGLEK